MTEIRFTSGEIASIRRNLVFLLIILILGIAALSIEQISSLAFFILWLGIFSVFRLAVVLKVRNPWIYACLMLFPIFNYLTLLYLIAIAFIIHNRALRAVEKSDAGQVSIHVPGLLKTGSSDAYPVSGNLENMPTFTGRLYYPPLSVRVTSIFLKIMSFCLVGYWIYIYYLFLYDPVVGWNWALLFVPLLLLVIFLPILTNRLVNSIGDAFGQGKRLALYSLMVVLIIGLCGAWLLYMLNSGILLTTITASITVFVCVPALLVGALNWNYFK